MLHSAFLNLLLNAVQYVKEGTLPIINVNSKQINSDIVISILDNGIGIEPAYRKTVFLLFKRLHNESTYPGNGIGLSIVKKVLDNIMDEYGSNRILLEAHYLKSLFL